MTRVPNSSDHSDHRAVALDGAVEQTLNGGHLPPSPNKVRVGTPGDAMPFNHGQQLTGDDWLSN